VEYWLMVYLKLTYFPTFETKIICLFLHFDVDAK